MDPQEVAELKKAIDWVKSWYAERAKLTRSDGFPYLTENEHSLIQSRLSELKVMVSEYPFLELYKEVLAGRLHLRKSLPESYHLTPVEVRRLKQASKDMVGFNSPSIKEPNVFLNPKELLDSNLYWETSESSMVHGSLCKAAIHEITHAVSAGMRNELVVESSLSPLTVRRRDDYYDRPSEIYARIAELRYSLNVEPGHVFTVQEVQKLRAKAEQDLKDYKKQVKEIGKKNIKSLEQLPIGDKLLDNQIFLRYSDEEITNLLNDTAFRDDKELDIEHQLNDSLDMPFVAKRETQRTYKETDLRHVIGHIGFKV